MIRQPQAPTTLARPWRECTNFANGNRTSDHRPLTTDHRPWTSEIDMNPRPLLDDWMRAKPAGWRSA